MWVGVCGEGVKFLLYHSPLFYFLPFPLGEERVKLYSEAPHKFPNPRSTNFLEVMSNRSILNLVLLILGQLSRHGGKKEEGRTKHRD